MDEKGVRTWETQLCNIVYQHSRMLGTWPVVAIHAVFCVQCLMKVMSFGSDLCDECACCGHRVCGSQNLTARC